MINADSVRKIADDRFEVLLPDAEHHGVLNGGHTLDLIAKRIKDGSIPPISRSGRGSRTSG